MMKTPYRLSLISMALAASLQLAACGGGSAGVPGVYPPTVKIESNVTGTAKGPVTYTFSFSEDVGDTFTLEDIQVEGGTVGAFTKVSATQYTLLITPPDASAGAIKVTVRKGSFSDTTGNVSESEPTTASTLFNTGAPEVEKPSGNTDTCTAAPCINFAESNLGLVDFGGLGIEVVADPLDAANKAVRLTKETADELWAGVTVHLGAAGNTVARIDPAQGISLRVYSPVAGETVMIKIEDGSNKDVFVEALATTTKAGEWETINFAYASADVNATYNKVSVFPAFNTKADKVFYIDELKYTEKSTTPPPPPPASGGSTGTCTAAPCINFAEATVGLADFGGLGVEVTADPVDATNKVGKLTKEAVDETWAGATVHLGAAGNTVARIDPAQGISLRVYSPAVNETVMIKIEDGAAPGVFVETSAKTTKAGEWETLTFAYASADVNKTYNKVSVFPAFNTKADKVFYIDELKYTEKTTTVTPPTTGDGIFSSGFSSAVLTANGGAIASAGGSNLDDWGCKGDWCGSGAGGSGADSFMYFYYQTPSPATGLYSQIEVFGPGVTGFSTTGDTGGVNVAGKSTLNFNFNPNLQWYQSPVKNLGVVLTLGKRYSIDNGCRLQLHGVKPITSDGNVAYTMNLLTDFRVAADCGAGIAPDNVAGALAASPVVSSVKFVGAAGGAALEGRNGVKTSANLSVADGVVYPTTVALKGAITFN